MSSFKALFLVITSILFVSCGQNKEILSFEAMNTFMTVQIYGKNASQAAREIKNRIITLENFLSTTKENSDLYRLNNSDSEIKVSPETYELLEFSKDFSIETEGALNPCLYGITSAWGFTTGTYRVPSSDEIRSILKNARIENLKFNKENCSVQLKNGMQVDLGAVGKGFAADEALKILKNYGINSAILDFGGNIQAVGNKIDGSEWNVGIKNPFKGSASCGVRINNKAVITSGGYERFFTADDGKSYIHIFDGKTGYPVENDIASVSIICDSGLKGDALSTAMFVMGTEKAYSFWQLHQDFEMVIITKENELYYTNGLVSSIRVIDDFKSITVLE